MTFKLYSYREKVSLKRARAARIVPKESEEGNSCDMNNKLIQK